ncbi:hypothetical protein [Halopenitus persicus]|uniref:Uncharacterized protein n=1 Tax=Halopenitus persicus TaxID=1048396 RepID=A0A1H3KJ07_9EURY|nr:hypothetical protein [Halopenitus persicus]QHS17848.1 hypothetical protein GWK26_12210 [haloarchaeon 3A1-DGR]SDY52113.1 hypothetical protein SAMN05216564_10638 [Halopenitus persicus]
MDARRLETALAEEFGGSAAERRVVARQARDLSDSGKPKRDRGHALTVPDVLRHLSDAPEGSSLVERWNWWLGALETAYGGYDRFTVRVVADDDEVDVDQ